ncbi:MAG: hypothetical protein BRC43_02185, partial [Cyanobacteria bacterium QS_3_48_167]
MLRAIIPTSLPFHPDCQEVSPWTEEVRLLQGLERLTELLQVVEQDERAAQLEKGLVHISTPLIP